ncbi:MAG TPA: hypothetical protein VG248_10755 [Caulobacteraceae bacterium]|jgi:hypothetical protein|nr:hypothetical protein [Caulobacteraceae bacterium]
MMRTRRTARVLLLDPDDRILLLKGRLPSDPQAPGLGGPCPAFCSNGRARLPDSN